MSAASVGATYLMPQADVTSKSQVPDLALMLPKTFGRWSEDRNTVPLEVSPDVARILGTIYDATLSRTYTNTENQSVMLSIAYGANQSRALQLHKPEVCYSSQGFRIGNQSLGMWRFDGVTIPTMHLVGTLGKRIEPVTYWMRIGNDIARGWLEQNLIRLKYGTRGSIPDGVLFRVSSISSDTDAAFELQRSFVQELLVAMTPEARRMFVGSVALGQAG